jgi:putative transposase
MTDKHLTVAGKHGHLPRLSREHYRGYAMVHWSMTLEKRFDRWLDDVSHCRFREIVLHSIVRYRLLCPAYCLMPDHMHMMLLGVDQTSDQQLAVAFIRRFLNKLLSARYDARLQREPYDHVLREKDRERNAFSATAFYVLENPVREGLVKTASEWQYGGCIVPGHPDWDVFHPKYWETFWILYAKRRGGEA